MIRSRLFIIFFLLALACCKEKQDNSTAPIPSGPAHWIAGSTPGKQDLLAVDFIDSQTAWAVGDIDPAGTGGAIYLTTDGGSSWRAAASSLEVLASIYFVSPARGWVAGYAGRIQRTDDGGRTWKTQRTEREGEVLNSIFFIDDKRGWAVGGVVGTGGLIFQTSNGGETWEPVETGRVESFWAVRFASAERGWIVGEEGLILATNDGGKTWAAQSSGTTRPLFGLALASADRLVAVGEAGTILLSEDGSAWQSVEAGTAETLNAVAAAGDKVFWAVGS
ncbi:MAG TPA: YCF48-related protein, partial [Blastocatellia bacterium]|nr:YCF48-related protein [Blastocatellia bacterium]